MPYKAEPKCGKCRRTSPEMKWGRWQPFGDRYIESIQPEHECLLLTCIRCRHQWLMQLAPREVVA